MQPRAIPLALAFAAMACAPGPDYVTKSGLGVYDPSHLSSADEIESWIQITRLASPRDRKESVSEVIDGATLTIYESDTIPNCVRASDLGCAIGSDIAIAWRACNQSDPSAGILAHEVGHLLGYHHDDHGFGTPWFFSHYAYAVGDVVAKAVCGS